MALRVVAGTPVAQMSDKLLETNDGGAFAMIWECSPGRFSWTYEMDEYLLILEGKVTLHGYDEPRAIAAGDLVLFKAGSVVEWEVHEKVRKVAVLRFDSRPATLLAKTHRRINGVLGL